jgi:hypothetical protein
MFTDSFEVGSRVYVTSYSPFRGLKGIVQKVLVIDQFESREKLFFYQVDLEGVQLKESLWFQNDEIEPLYSLQHYTAS